MPPGIDNLRVLVVADDPLARTGLAALISERSGVTVVGQMSASAGLTAALDAYTPEVIIWDMGWDPASITEPLADLRDSGTSVIVLLADASHAAEAQDQPCRDPGSADRSVRPELKCVKVAIAPEPINLDDSPAPPIVEHPIRASADRGRALEPRRTGNARPGRTVSWRTIRRSRNYSAARAKSVGTLDCAHAHAERETQLCAYGRRFAAFALDHNARHRDGRMARSAFASNRAAQILKFKQKWRRVS